MFEVSIELLKQLINIIPLFTCIILIFNLVSDMLWGGK